MDYHESFSHLSDVIINQISLINIIKCKTKTYQWNIVQHNNIYIYIYIIYIAQSRWCSTISIFRQQAAFVRNVQIKLYLYVPDKGSLLPKYRDCSTSNDFELYLMCCGVMLQ